MRELSRYLRSVPSSGIVALEPGASASFLGGDSPATTIRIVGDEF